MKNTLINSKFHSLKHSNNKDALASLKVVVFEMGNLNLALRIETVYKILNQSPVYGSGLNGLGIAHVDEREVTVVDLHRRLFQSRVINEAFKKGYLIIVQNMGGELYGIPVAAVPVLREVPLSKIQVLPDSYRQANLLGIASHFCHISQAEASLIIFLLDVDKLLQN